MGAVSDRVGRKGPLAGGLMGLVIATLMLAYAETLPAMFRRGSPKARPTR